MALILHLLRDPAPGKKEGPEEEPAKMASVKIITYFAALAAIAALLAAGGPLMGEAMAQETVVAKAEAPKAEAPKPLEHQALVGEVPVNLMEPQGMARVDGMCPQADEFILSLRERFKLKVLAVYADPDQWRDFAEAVARKEPRALPRMAVIAVTTKMDGKHYDRKAAAKERRKFNNMVSLAINTRPLTAIFSNRANAKLRDKLGVDLRFSYRGYGEHVGKFEESERSVSYSVLASLSVYGQRTDSFATISAIRVGDKFVFLAFVEPAQAPDLIGQAKAKTLEWVRRMGEGNLAGA